MKKMLNKGFTLVELMIVVAIIAILAAVAIPQMGDQIKKAQDSKALAIVGAARTAVMTFNTDNLGDYPTNIDEIDSTDYLDQKSVESLVALSGETNGYLEVGTGEGVAKTDDAAGTNDVATALAATDDSIELVYNTTTGGISLQGGAGTATATDTKGIAWSTY